FIVKRTYWLMNNSILTKQDIGTSTIQILCFMVGYKQFCLNMRTYMEQETHVEAAYLEVIARYIKKESRCKCQQQISQTYVHGQQERIMIHLSLILTKRMSVHHKCRHCILTQMCSLRPRHFRKRIVLLQRRKR